MTPANHKLKNKNKFSKSGTPVIETIRFHYKV